MKLDKLARQIRRDISASPKKAAALGLMLLVAIYFWAPMVWRWVAASKPKVAAGSGVILDDEPVDPAVQAFKSRQVFPWERIRKLATADPRMTPAVFEPTWHDPFRKIDPPGSAQQPPPAPQGANNNLPEIDPAASGLALTGVAIGTRRRTATIGGEIYLEGETVQPMDKEGNPTGVEYKLVRVGYQEVELERNGKKYTLALSRPRLAQGDEITPSHRD